MFSGFFSDFLLLKKHMKGIRSNFHCVLNESDMVVNRDAECPSKDTGDLF